MNVEMAKLAFAKGIWNYVCKMDHALRGYASFYPRTSCSVLTMRRLIKQVLLLKSTSIFNLFILVFSLRYGG